MNHTTFALVLTASTALWASGCTKSDRTSQARPTQAALSTAVRSVIPVANSEEASEERNRLQAERLPSLSMANGKLQVTADEFHDGAHATSVANGWAVSWSDKTHRRSYLALADAEGHATGGAAMVHQSVSADEDVYAPDVISVAGGYVMVWTDPANNRVRFQRLDATRRPMGRATIIHDGLESPRSTRVVENGSEFAVGVAMDHGVYFARVGRDGERLGDGVLVAENVSVKQIESIRPNASGVELTWTDSAGAPHNARLTREGRLVAAGGSRDAVAAR
jgi:hypothetical protein